MSNYQLRERWGHKRLLNDTMMRRSAKLTIGDTNRTVTFKKCHLKGDGRGGTAID